MIAYIDSSLLTRAYLTNEEGHVDALDLLDDDSIALITGTWTRIEVSGALARAARVAGSDPQVFFEALDTDLDPVSGSIREVPVAQQSAERLALRIVRAYGVRAMDAWHLACAALVLPDLAEGDEPYGFATRDDQQAAVALAIGLEPI